ncbi:MAG: hypothetical protein KKH94_13305 [Candidatus Omnitrophica bacterium]|nr:hypothetical protein [Candidatus Omnitrophota bacterium]
MKTKLFFKVISLSITFIFTVTTIAWSAPSVYTINVPEEEGKVIQRYKGEGDKVIVHVQDAHVNSEAQFNLAKIICSLIPQLSDEANPFVGIEGAIGEYDLKILREYPID